MGRYNDLSGQTFGRLKVLERCEDYVKPSGQHLIRYLCQCQCKDKTLVKVKASSLREGSTKSCGCLRREVLSKRFVPNIYELYDDYGVGYTNNGMPFYFDREDYDKIKDYRWYINRSGYVVSKNVRMNRLVMDCPDDMVVDHIHGKETRNDNRKSNLRLATLSENSHNVGVRKNNSSGVVGVGYIKRFGKWRARIMIDGNEIHLGYFDNFDEAVEARKEAEKKYYQCFSYGVSQSQVISNIVDFNNIKTTSWTLVMIDGVMYAKDDDDANIDLSELLKQHPNIKVILTS